VSDGSVDKNPPQWTAVAVWGLLAGIALALSAVVLLKKQSWLGFGWLVGLLALHVKPDFANTKFALFMGTAPSQAGNPFKRQGRLLAQARRI